MKHKKIVEKTTHFDTFQPIDANPRTLIHMDTGLFYC